MHWRASLCSTALPFRSACFDSSHASDVGEQKELETAILTELVLRRHAAQQSIQFRQVLLQCIPTGTCLRRR
jgi:hypothetical protein